jgi:hypothetical protein
MNIERDGRWADWKSTVALTGILPADLAWLIKCGMVEYSLSRPGHAGILMVCVDDVESLITAVGGQTVRGQRHLRIVRDEG